MCVYDITRVCMCRHVAFYCTTQGLAHVCIHSTYVAGAYGVCVCDVVV